MDTARSRDETLIGRTYALARNAAERGNHPFGALLARGGSVLLELENEVVTSGDVTRHAETGLIARATASLSETALRESALYTSTEPCIMCCGAIHWAGVPTIVFGVRGREMVAAFGGTYRGIPAREVFSRLNPTVEIRGPLLEPEGLEIHRAFWPEFLKGGD